MQSSTAPKTTAKNRKRLFSKQNRSKFVSLRGRSAAVAIFKPKVWHPAAKHGSANRQKSRRTSRISIRPAGTPQRRFSGSAISRGRKSAFPVRSILRTAKGRISLRSLAVPHSGMPSRSVKDCRVGRTRPPRNDTKLAGFMKKPASFLIKPVS